MVRVNLTVARIAGFSRRGGNIYAASQGLAEWLRLAAGRVSGQATFVFTHTNVNPVNVYAVSSGMSDTVLVYSETSINANANQTFSGFDALLLSAPANIDRVNITFANGFNDDFTPAELRAWLGMSQNSDATGILNGALLVPGEGVKSVTVFVNGLGNCVVGVSTPNRV